MVTRYKIVYPDDLNHHGVKGMKWGVRKNPEKEWDAARKAHNANVSKYWNEAQKRGIYSKSGKKFSRESKKLSKEIGLKKSYKASNKAFKKYKASQRKDDLKMTTANKKLKFAVKDARKANRLNRRAEKLISKHGRTRYTNELIKKAAYYDNKYSNRIDTIFNNFYSSVSNPNNYSGGYTVDKGYHIERRK